MHVRTPFRVRIPVLSADFDCAAGTSFNHEHYRRSPLNLETLDCDRVCAENI